MKRILFDKTYGAEGLCDVERDVYEAIEYWDMADVPLNEDYPEFFEGEIRIVIEYVPPSANK